MTAAEGRGLEWIAPPPADRRQALLPVPDGGWPGALVVGRDAHAGRRYVCPCGWTGWSAFGRANLHRETCPMTPRPPRLTEPQARVLSVLEPYRAGTTWARYLSASDVAGWWPGAASTTANGRAISNMAAGRVLRRLHAAHLVTKIEPRHRPHRPAGWRITTAGLEAMRAHQARPRRIVTVNATTRET